MSHHTPADLTLFCRVAADLREVFAERGYRVDLALEADQAFGSGMSRAALRRDLAIDAVSESASRNGLDFRPVNGSGRELRHGSRGVYRRYRFLSGKRQADGSLLIKANSDSALVGPEDEETLIPEERWVWAYTTVPSLELIDEVVIAEIRGFIEGRGRAGQLVLGPEVALLQPLAPPPVGFTPPDENELDFGDDDEAGEEDSGS